MKRLMGNMVILTGLMIALLTILPVGCVMAETAVKTAVLAEKVDPSDLKAGDAIVLVNENAGCTLSENLSGMRISCTELLMASTATRQVLTGLAEDAAVFELLEAGEGNWYLRCDQGYLTSADSGNALYYAGEPEACSQWAFQEGAYLYNPNAVYQDGEMVSRNGYVEYYASTFMMYSKQTGADSAPFLLGFYRMGNSLPDEEITQSSFYTLPVFHTSDVHGYLADVTKDEPQYLLAYISDRIKDVRGGRKDLAVLLDSGDIYQGQTLSNLMKGNPLSAAFDRMGYDAVSIGNHEFDWGIESMVDADATMMDYDFGDGEERIRGENSIPVLASNLYRNGQKVSFARDSVILQKTAQDWEGNELSVRIGVIGLAGEYEKDIMKAKFTDLGYSVVVDYGAVNAMAKELEESGKCDATILLAHENARTVAEGLGADTCIDLVLGGHTHNITEGITSWGLPFLESSCYSNAYGFAYLAFSVQEERPVFEKAERIRVAPVTALANTPENASYLDAEIVGVTDVAVEQIRLFLDTKIGSITEPVYRFQYFEGSGDRSTSCGNWAASILARIVDADVAFVNAGGLRLDMPIEEGKDRREITRSDAYTLFPFNNTVYRYRLTYEELLTALEYALTEKGSSLLSQMVGIDCYYIGESVKALVTKDGDVIYANGGWKDGWREKTLTVALQSFVATSDRPVNGLSNPFVSWNDTERLLECSKTDNVGAVDVLTEEAAANDGHLSIDMHPYFHNRNVATVTPPAAAELRSEGMQQNLVTAGSTDAGTLVYALGTDSQTPPDHAAYSAEIPTAAGEGIYCVWFKAVNEDGLTLSDTDCIEVNVVTPEK